MNSTGSDIVLFLHVVFGGLGTLIAIWLFVETLNASESNAGRIRAAALLIALCMCAAWAFGGYWYVHFYPADKATILKGPWPFAHNIVMETKEHLFFLTLILSFYLPIAVRDRLYANRGARKMVLCVALLIALTGLGIEGAGGLISFGDRVALQASSKGAH